MCDTLSRPDEPEDMKMYRTLHERLSSRGEVAHARWHLAHELGLAQWPEREQDAERLALELGLLSPPWLDIEPAFRPHRNAPMARAGEADQGRAGCRTGTGG